MRECPKCGRTNLPTRKFCVRCGASLIKSIEPEQPKVKAPIAKETPVAAQKEQPVPAAANSLSRSTDDKWVRPSEVAKDRVRHAEKHTGKTEMEKAMEAFKKAETVGIDEETGEGIVETRMLRASEVRELLESAESFVAQPELQPNAIAPEPGVPGIPQEPVPAAPTPKDIEQSLLGSKSGYVKQPPKEPPATLKPVSVPTAPPSGPPTGFAPQPPAQPSVQTPKVSPQPSAAPPSAPPTTPTLPAEVDSTPPTPAPQSQQQVEELAQAATEKVEALLSKIPRPEYLKDSVIQKIVTDFRGFHLDLRKFEVELASVRTQWDEMVRLIKNAEETKRLQYEGLTEQVRLAKDEWDRAVKNHKKVESEKKNEISSRENRIKETNKTISQVEKALERRVRDLEKEREQSS